MLRIIAVRTGDKFDQWYEDNLKYMIDTHSQLKYDEFVVIRDDQYEGVFNKLLMRFLVKTKEFIILVGAVGCTM